MSSISAGTTTGTSLVALGDTTGTLVLKTNGSTTAVTIDENQDVVLAGKLDVTGALDVTGSTTLSSVNLSAGLVVAGLTSIKSIRETATISATAATGTINFDVNTQAVLYYTSSASADWTLNIRGDSGTTLNSLMTTGQSLTIAFLATIGATEYRQTALTVDGSSVTPKWQGGDAPTEGNINSVDIYSITLIKTADATFTAFEAITQFA